MGRDKQQGSLFGISELKPLQIREPFFLVHSIQRLVFPVEFQKYVMHFCRKRSYGIYDARDFSVIAKLDSGPSVKFQIFLGGYAPRPDGSLIQTDNQANQACAAWGLSMKNVTNLQSCKQRRMISHFLFVQVIGTQNAHFFATCLILYL